MTSIFNYNLTNKELIFAIGLYIFLILTIIYSIYYYKKYMK